MGDLLGDSDKQTEKFQNVKNLLGRFDQFIQMSNGVGIARSYYASEIYQALNARTHVQDDLSREHIHPLRTFQL